MSLLKPLLNQWSLKQLVCNSFLQETIHTGLGIAIAEDEQISSGAQEVGPVSSPESIG